MNFDAPETLSALPSLTREDLDALAFGVIKVNDTGIVEVYNKYESELACVPPAKAEGKNFFTQIAPCTNNRLILGRFKEGVAAGELDASIPYTFTYKMRPTNVVIRLYRDSGTKTNWVLVKKR